MKKAANGLKQYLDKPYFSYFTLPAFVFIIVESLSQRSFIGAFRLLFLSPHLFILNLLIVYTAFSVCLFVRRKLFFYSIISLAWMAIGITDFILLGMRNSPFCATDLLIFRYGFLLTLKYMNTVGIIFSVIGIIALPTFFVILYRKGFKFTGRINFRKSILITVITVLLTAMILLIGLLTGFLKARYEKPKYDYNKYGLPYSFMCSMFVSGVEKPQDYSESTVSNIINNIEQKETNPKIKPNVVFIQLESFFDIDRLDYPVEDDVLPTFHKMCEGCPSGSLSVHTLGGGTSNTEFEVLTGMSLEFFGPVEFPFESYVDNTPCESIAYNLKSAGYHTDAIHTYSAGFYNRNIVYPNLGFDTFTSFEYMNSLVYNDLGWVKDSVLERYIIKALEKSEKPDFVFGVSVQGHGSYPTDFNDEAQSSSDYSEYSEETANQIEYYLSQLKETDAMLASLTQELSELGEPTVLVLYGDHIPGISFSESMISGGLYKTEYVIWSNYDLTAEDKDIDAYYLSSYVLDLIDIHTGVLNKFHQQFRDSSDYNDNLKTIEYDIASGDLFTYNGSNPYTATDMKMGIDRIAPLYVKTVNGDLYVYGSNFNNYTTVYINSSRRGTEYISPQCVMVKEASVQPGDKIKTGQLNYQNYFNMLSFSDEIVIE